MRVLLWRNWKSLYSFPAIFSVIANHSIGGTCAQLLWHARALARLGCSVQVLGATAVDCVQESVEFIGSNGREEQERLIESGRVAEPEAIFLEGAFSAAGCLRRYFPKAHIIHIGQNIDARGAKKALAHHDRIDLYAFVSPGHLAEYAIAVPYLRSQFDLVRNSVPWYSLYRTIKRPEVEDRICWIGAWTKTGLRRWGRTMELFLEKNPTYTWHLHGPSHGSHTSDQSNTVLRGLHLPKDRVIKSSLPLIQLASEIGKARIAIVSLGNETACISALDAHAMGRPVVSGDDIVFFFNNPEATGLRVNAATDRLAALTLLVENHQLATELGVGGREMIRRQFKEQQQQEDLERVLRRSRTRSLFGSYKAKPPPSNAARRVYDALERLDYKVRSVLPNVGE